MSSSTIRFNISRHQVEFPMDSQPATLTRRGSKALGIILIGFAAIWGGFPTVMLLKSLHEIGQKPELLATLLFPVLGTALALYGLHTLLWRKAITIDKYFVSVEESGLRGARQWQEMLQSYRGVKSRTRRVRTKNSSYTLYIIELLHEDDDKTIRLYTSRSERNWRGKWEAYARWLKLPALEEGLQGLVARDVEDLDKSVAELIDEGKVEVDYEVLKQKAEGLAVDIEGDDLVVTRTGPQNGLLVSLLMLAFPLIFVYIGFFFDDIPLAFGLIFGFAGLFFEALFIAAVVWDRISRHRLRIGPKTLRVCTIGPKGETKGKTMPVAAVETVQVARRERQSAAQVMISSDRKKLRFGNGLPQASLEFAANAVLAKIAKHNGRT